MRCAHCGALCHTESLYTGGHGYRAWYICPAHRYLGDGHTMQLALPGW